MNLASNVNFFLGLQSQLKIFHWQTKGYARHMAFGETYEVLDGLIDSFVESAMGKYERFVLSEEDKDINLINLNEIKPKEMVHTCIKALEEMSDTLDPKDTDLMNIKDEMIQSLSKLLYLLTLE
jgi:DNA-binding ferritin-like protein